MWWLSGRQGPERSTMMARRAISVGASFIPPAVFLKSSTLPGIILQTHTTVA
jgi:hypothetical protein